MNEKNLESRIKRIKDVERRTRDIFGVEIRDYIRFNPKGECEEALWGKIVREKTHFDTLLEVLGALKILSYKEEGNYSLYRSGKCFNPRFKRDKKTLYFTELKYAKAFRNFLIEWKPELLDITISEKRDVKLYKEKYEKVCKKLWDKYKIDLGNYVGLNTDCEFIVLWGNVIRDKTTLDVLLEALVELEILSDVEKWNYSLFRGNRPFNPRFIGRRKTLYFTGLRHAEGFKKVLGDRYRECGLLIIDNSIKDLTGNLSPAN